MENKEYIFQVEFDDTNVVEYIPVTAKNIRTARIKFDQQMRAVKRSFWLWRVFREVQ